MWQEKVFRIVGWGPIPLPRENRRWKRAYEAAVELVETAEQLAEDAGPSTVAGPRVGAVVPHGRDLATGEPPAAERQSDRIMSTDWYEYRIREAGPDSCTIGIVTGDILNVLGVKIWVNCENTDMDMARETEDSISGIIRYWGGKPGRSNRLDKKDPQSDVIAHLLAEAVSDTIPVAPGSAFTTESGRLKKSHGVHYIIHVAAVQGEPGAGFRRVQNIELCVTNALDRAEALATKEPSVSSIIFPLLGTGMGGAKLETTVKTLVTAARRYVESGRATALQKIYFLAYSHSDLNALLHILADQNQLYRVTAGEGDRA